MERLKFALLTGVSLLFLNCQVLAQFRLNAPAGLRVQLGSASHVNLVWEDHSDGEGGFLIERKKKDDPFWVKIGFVPSDTTQFQAGGCAAAVEYAFRVRAYKGAAYSDYSNIAKAKTLQSFDKPQGSVIESSTPRQGEGTAIRTNNGNYQLYFGSFTGVGDKSVSSIARKASTNKGNTWSEMEILFQEEGISLLHPSVIRFSEKRIGLAYSKMVKGRAWKVFRYSMDEGETWSEEINVSDGIYEYMTGAHDRFVRLSNGLVVNLVHSIIPAEDDQPKGKLLGTDLYATQDQGLTWFRLNSETVVNQENPYGLGEYGFYEASLAEYEPGRLVMFGRSASGFLMGSYSDDFGKTWSDPEKFGIQHPLAPARVQMIPGTNEILLIHNSMKDVTSTRGASDRYVLAARLSKDGGQTWKHYKQLEYDNVHHYSYPAILIDGARVHLFYWKTELKNNRWAKVELAHRALPLEYFISE
ncbi:BNR repeat protein [Anseongella ginsenosidimutans]|uniref:BNR repeat protein n=1 Tax=Anseongella ginsenosidimutans TaxID=496056 RepID=A0A4R3KP68_9SPHI|nr:exo-alpha-sialidase [Anseongella ginsenosidimutans]QEC52372.1 hypothetical protein FRZ59_08525 [Anseongella ginsenosidimutans]TCS85886.1 BNR repeat protein [Anseongella ginsenosidimutans]